MKTIKTSELQLQEVGEVMHLANSGRVIVRLNSEVPEGQILCDSKSQKIAKVTELIGPVSSPFASAIPLTNNLRKLVERKFLRLIKLLQKKKQEKI